MRARNSMAGAHHMSRSHYSHGKALSPPTTPAFSSRPQPRQGTCGAMAAAATSAMWGIPGNMDTALARVAGLGSPAGWNNAVGAHQRRDPCRRGRCGIGAPRWCWWVTMYPSRARVEGALAISCRCCKKATETHHRCIIDRDYVVARRLAKEQRPLGLKMVAETRSDKFLTSHRMES